MNLQNFAMIIDFGLNESESGNTEVEVCIVEKQITDTPLTMIGDYHSMQVLDAQYIGIDVADPIQRAELHAQLDAWLDKALTN